MWLVREYLDSYAAWRDEAAEVADRVRQLG